MGRKRRSARKKPPQPAAAQGAEEQPAAAAAQGAEEQPAAATAPAPAQGAEKQPAAATAAAVAEVPFLVKTVDFCGNSRTVVFPPATHRSAFVALVNALLLNGRLSPGTINSEQVSNSHFMLRMIRRYSRTLKDLELKMLRDQIIDTLKHLSRSMDISINFTRIDGIMSKTVPFDIFEHMGVSLYHLQIIDPQDTVVALALGDDYHEMFRDDLPPTPIPNADQPVVDFIQGTGLTAFGLQELSKAMENDQISVVFWNRTFHTVVKHDDGLYALYNDLRFFEGNALWKELKVGGDGQLCKSDFSPVLPTAHVQDEPELAWELLPENRESSELAATSIQQLKHKCIRSGCSSIFCSVLNLNRHNQVHKKDREPKMEFVSKIDISQFWNRQLSAEERSELLSLKSAPDLNGINGPLIYHYLEKVGPDNVYYSIANKVKLIMDCAEKVGWDDLFAVLVEASEGTTFRMDIRQCPHSNIFAGGLPLLHEVPNVVACYSYFLERSLVEQWLKYKEDEALQNASFFLDDKSDGHPCGKQNCTLRFNSEINFNRHQSVHAIDFDPKEDFMLNRDEIGNFWDNLSNVEAAGLLSYHDMIVESFRGKKLARQLKKLVQNSTVAKCLQTMLTSSLKPTSDNLFDILDKASEETLFCDDILKCKENTIFKDNIQVTSTSNVLACISYMLEKKLVHGWSDLKALSAGKIRESEKYEKSVESKGDSVDSNPSNPESNPPESQEDSGHKSDSSDSCEDIFQRIPFEKYARKHKFTRVYKFLPKWMFKLFRKHLKKFKKTFKRNLSILTWKGRNCARGFLTYIIKMHMRKKCWNGEWHLSDMEVLNGKFIISKEALLDLTAERVAQDFKRFIELVLKPYYHNKQLESFPLYFDEFEEDLLHIPDPTSNLSEFLNFEKYLALHFAFMPPLSRSTLIILLYKAIESVRYQPPSQYWPLCYIPKCDWRTHVKDLPFIHDLYYYGVDDAESATLSEPYSPSPFSLLKFCRHFGSYDTDHTKLIIRQQLDDVISTDLMLGQLLSSNITELILEIVKWTHMEGRYLNIFQAFEASDGGVVFCIDNECDDDISEESSTSSDDEN